MKRIIILLVFRFISYLINKKIHRKDFFIDYAYDNEERASGEDLDIEVSFNELPKSAILSDNSILNQWRTNWCVAYASTNGINESNQFFGDYRKKDPIELKDYIKNNLDPEIDKNGTFIINWQKWAIALWWAIDYNPVRTINEVKISILDWFSVQTWSNKISWGETWLSWVATEWVGGWHAISIVWYDDNLSLVDFKWNIFQWWFVVENTWWEHWGKKWRYYIPYEKFNLLFNTKNSLIVQNKQEYEKIINEIKIYKDKWIKRIRIYDDLRVKWYKRTMILSAMREVYWLPKL